MSFTAFYDLQFGPISYDFITWLIRAKKEAGSNRLHVVIVPKEDGLGGFSRVWGHHDEHAARWRLWHIVVASCPLAEATVTVAPSRDVAYRMRGGLFWWPDGKAHFMGPLVKASKDGEPIPRLRATEQARRYVREYVGEGRSLVTLTLRRQETDQARNTNPVAWAEFRCRLELRGFHVVVLDEVNDALRHGRGYAELDPDLRLALYEAAYMNVIGNNGPQELLKFSHAPYLAFGQALSDGWKDHFRKYFHMEPGEQLPWAGPRQKMVYREDSLANLMDEFERMTSGPG